MVIYTLDLISRWNEGFPLHVKFILNTKVLCRIRATKRLYHKDVGKAKNYKHPKGKTWYVFVNVEFCLSWFKCSIFFLFLLNTLLLFTITLLPWNFLSWRCKIQELLVNTSSLHFIFFYILITMFWYLAIGAEKQYEQNKYSYQRHYKYAKQWTGNQSGKIVRT